MRPNAGTTYLKHPIPIVQHQQFHPIPKPPNPNTKQPGIRPGTSESNEALQWLCQAKHVSWRVKEMMSLACWFGPIVLLVVSGMRWREIGIGGCQMGWNVACGLCVGFCR